MYNISYRISINFLYKQNVRKMFVIMNYIFFIVIAVINFTLRINTSYFISMIIVLHESIFNTKYYKVFLFITSVEFI